VTLIRLRDYHLSRWFVCLYHRYGHLPRVWRRSRSLSVCNHVSAVAHLQPYPFTKQHILQLSILHRSGWHIREPQSVRACSLRCCGRYVSYPFAFQTLCLTEMTGIHCDSNGNVYAACGDGIHVWNPSGTLLGKIFTGELTANFQFAGKGRMVLLAETHLYYATLAAEGASIM
jgi:hypothetical protein